MSLFTSESLTQPLQSSVGLFEVWVIDRRTFKSTLEKSADDIVKEGDALWEGVEDLSPWDLADDFKGLDDLDIFSLRLLPYKHRTW